MTTIASKIVSRVADVFEFAEAQRRTLQHHMDRVDNALLSKMQRHMADLYAELDTLLDPLGDDGYLAAFELADREVERRRDHALKLARARKDRERQREEFARAFPELVGSHY